MMEEHARLLRLKEEATQQLIGATEAKGGAREKLVGIGRMLGCDINATDWMDDDDDDDDEDDEDEEEDGDEDEGEVSPTDRSKTKFSNPLPEDGKEDDEEEEDDEEDEDLATE